MTDDKIGRAMVGIRQKRKPQHKSRTVISPEIERLIVHDLQTLNWTQAEISVAYNVSPQAVSKIKKRNRIADDRKSRVDLTDTDKKRVALLKSKGVAPYILAMAFGVSTDFVRKLG